MVMITSTPKTPAAINEDNSSMFSTKNNILGIHWWKRFEQSVIIRTKHHIAQALGVFYLRRQNPGAKTSFISLLQ